MPLEDWNVPDKHSEHLPPFQVKHKGFLDFTYSGEAGFVVGI